MQEVMEMAERILRDGRENKDKEFEITLSCDWTCAVLDGFAKQTLRDMGEDATEGINWRINGFAGLTLDGFPELPGIIWNKLYLALTDANEAKNSNLSVGMSFREVSTIGETLLEGELDKDQIVGYLDLLNRFVLVGGMDNRDLRVKYLNLMKSPK